MPRLTDPEQYKKATDKLILYTAQQVHHKEVERSTLFHSTADATTTENTTATATATTTATASALPKFEWDELRLGRVVGRGGFCVVREVQALKLHNQKKSSSRRRTPALFSRTDSNDKDDNQKNNNNNNNNTSSREYLARRVWSKGSKYVVKQLNEDLLEVDRVNYLKGLIDLSLELEYLASLDHVNILGIRGVARHSPFDQLGYFLILDQLQETLSKRLNKWMLLKRTTVGLTGILCGGKKKIQKLLVDRLLVAHDVAEGMSYLHSRNIIFRDLKPDNIGFDAEDTLKIFDFGLAKELIASERGENNLYLMTGFTGAVRYMAPEVGLRKPYNLKADVYSWSMLMWYIMALEPPMGFYTPSMFVDRVFRKGHRPVLKDKWPDSLKKIMKQCWSENIAGRPDFAEILMTLRREAQAQDPHTLDFLLADAGSGRSRSSTASNRKR